LGSDRHTDDLDYLVSIPGEARFLHSEDGDLVNAAGSKFLTEVLATCEDGVASPQALAELCGWAFIQHCQNFNFSKADAKEYDLGFLAREYGISETPILAKFEDAGPVAEVHKILAAKAR
jgi:hypothetical protein